MGNEDGPHFPKKKNLEKEKFLFFKRKRKMGNEDQALFPGGKMIGFLEEKEFYKQIQDHLFEMIPENWKIVFLHTSFLDFPNQIPKGELFVYYIPKGLLKRKPVNCYEIPALFEIDEEQYSRLITSLYNTIKKLRDSYFKKQNEKFTTIDITCTNKSFIVKYGFEDLLSSNYSLEEQHLIWRYENLQIDLDSLDKKDRKIIEGYIQESKVSLPKKEEIVETEIFERPANAVVDYEKSLTLDEIVARNKEQERLEEKRRRKEEKRMRKKHPELLEEAENAVINNEILKNKNL